MSQARSKTLSRFGFPDSVPSEPGDSYRLAEGTKMDPSDDLSILAGMKLLTLFVVVTIEISALDGHERGHLAPAKRAMEGRDAPIR